MSNRVALQPITNNVDHYHQHAFNKARKSTFSKAYIGNNYRDTSISGATHQEEVALQREEYRRKKREEQQQRLDMHEKEIKLLKEAIAKKRDLLYESRQRKKKIVEKYAATCIQSIFRMKLAMKKLLVKQKEQTAVKLLQRVARGFLQRKKLAFAKEMMINQQLEASLKIQKAVRVFQARKVLAGLFAVKQGEHTATTLVQKIFRGYLVRNKEWRNNAATVIQWHVMRWIYNRKVREEEEKRHVEEARMVTLAVLNIQRWWNVRKTLWDKKELSKCLPETESASGSASRELGVDIPRIPCPPKGTCLDSKSVPNSWRHQKDLQGGRNSNDKNSQPQQTMYSSSSRTSHPQSKFGSKLAKELYELREQERMKMIRKNAERRKKMEVKRKAMEAEAQKRVKEEQSLRERMLAEKKKAEEYERRERKHRALELARKRKKEEQSKKQKEDARAEEKRKARLRELEERDAMRRKKLLAKAKKQKQLEMVQERLEKRRKEELEVMQQKLAKQRAIKESIERQKLRNAIQRQKQIRQMQEKREKEVEIEEQRRRSELRKKKAEELRVAIKERLQAAKEEKLKEKETERLLQLRKENNRKKYANMHKILKAKDMARRNRKKQQQRKPHAPTAVTNSNVTNNSIDSKNMKYGRGRKRGKRARGEINQSSSTGVSHKTQSSSHNPNPIGRDLKIVTEPASNAKSDQMSMLDFIKKAKRALHYVSPQKIISPPSRSLCTIHEQQDEPGTISISASITEGKPHQRPTIPGPPSIPACSPLPTPGTFGNMLLEESKNWRVAFEAESKKTHQDPESSNLDYSFDFEEE
eukprot:g575.t1